MSRHYFYQINVFSNATHKGTALGRAGRVHISQQNQLIWVGGDIVTCIQGTLTL